MNSPSTPRGAGHGLARATSVVLVLSTIFALLATAQGLYGTVVEGRQIAEVAVRSSLPIFLLAAAVSWLLLFPIGTLLGFVTLVMLLLTRNRFPADGAPDRPV